MHIPDAITTIVKEAHQAGSKLVLATGVFDVFHVEHLVFLQKAQAVGDVLVVGVESDSRVRRLKGEGRPRDTQEVRKQKIENTHLADGVFILPEIFDSAQDHLKLLQVLKPNILAVSSHTPFLEEKVRLMQLIDGRVEVVHQHNPAISTTKVLEEAETRGKKQKEIR